MEITKGNRIIAVGVGIKFDSEKDWIYWLNKCQYHNSWNWLAPELEKICKVKLKYENIDEYYYKSPRSFGIINEDTGNFIVRLNCAPMFEAPTLIEATWLAIVDYYENI